MLRQIISILDGLIGLQLAVRIQREPHFLVVDAAKSTSVPNQPVNRQARPFALGPVQHLISRRIIHELLALFQRLLLVIPHLQRLLRLVHILVGIRLPILLWLIRVCIIFLNNVLLLEFILLRILKL